MKTSGFIPLTRRNRKALLTTGRRNKRVNVPNSNEKAVTAMTAMMIGMKIA
jgi:hypothetical protein